MSKSKSALWFFLAATTAFVPTAVFAAHAQEGGAPLIPRAELFGNPSKTNAQISPDGQWIAFLAPSNGVLNIWVAPAGKVDEAKVVTASTDRPIRQIFWANNSAVVLYLNDKGGDENFLLYSADPATGENKLITDFPKTRVVPFGGSESRPDEMVIGLNNRDPRYFDPYLLNTRTGALTKIADNTEEYDGYVVDDALKLRFASKANQDGSVEVFKLDDALKATSYTKIGFEDAQTTAPAGMTTDGKTLYFIESRDRDTIAVTATNLETGETKVVAQDPKADIQGTIADPVSGALLAYSTHYLKTEWTAIDPAIQGDIDFLNANLKGQWTLNSQSRDNTVWVLTNDPVTASVNYQLYDRKAKTLTKLFDVRPALADDTLAPMYGVEIKSRDGLTLPSFLTLPAGADTNGDGKPETPVPMVLNVHGGPWAQDQYGYDAEAQWLANRGYAVLQVNYRGSTGYGKNFINAADREWGGKMHDDLLDAVKWAEDEGITTPDKVAIYGGSYGGYATMVGMTFTPTTFACGVDIVGVTNLNTFMNTIPPYWESGKPQLYRRVGDPTTEEGKAFLASRSPITKIGDIQRPLLVAQGANDPRVNKDESDQIVNAMKEKGLPVTYVLYPDEGHGFAKPANRTSFYAISEGFLSQCLGGRYQPVGTDFDGASLQVLEGADHVPGLTDALAAKPTP
ncbi:Dipeptidyl aminopeptidase BIII [Alphaproteobacteria bacterium SO-S41]|nr:Dipeptidyl aminopeptidase BIII [Alphaproteobacteria bacterium SO-S41]